MLLYFLFFMLTLRTIRKVFYFNTKMSKYIAIIIALFILTAIPRMATCQEDTERCITVDDLFHMVNMSPSDKTWLEELMQEKGFQWIGDTIKREQLSNTLILEYISTNAYYDKINWDSPAITIFNSKDGLCNIVKMKLGKNICHSSMRHDLDNHNFRPSNGGQLYKGSYEFDGKISEYEVEYHEDSSALCVTIKNKKEIDEYTKRLLKERENTVYSKMDIAQQLCSRHLFNEAYSTIDSAMGIYSPLDTSLYNLRRDIRIQHIGFLCSRLSKIVNDKNYVSDGISICNEILALDNKNDSINEIRNILINHAKNEYQPYSKFNPMVYKSTVATLDNIINTEILRNPSLQKQTISLEFNFNTDDGNHTNGSINLGMYEFDGYTPVNKMKLTDRNEKLQRYVSSIAKGPLIAPATKYGLAINTHERITCDVEWICHGQYIKMVRGKKISSNNEMKPYLDSINKIYLKNISPKTKKDTLPYKVVYKVVQWDKIIDGEPATDIRILDIKTSNKLSWMPSLIVPGLGTCIQGYHSSVVARALPFALFTTFAALGFSWEKGKGKEINRPEWGSENSSRFWEYKNFGYIAGYVGLAVAATIYINDLTESIIASKRNIKRTQRLRDAFEKNKYINLQTQDIQLEKTKE